VVLALVGVTHVYDGVCPYSISDTCNSVPSSFTNFIVYLFTAALYVAVYVAHVVTSDIVGVHHAKAYVYCAVAAFVGSAGFTISPDVVP
jgi:hypothetical protein